MSRELLKENEILKGQLAEAMATIQALRLENAAMAKRLETFSQPIQPQTMPGVEGSICSLCQREVPAANIEMHQIHCMKSFKKCPACNVLLKTNEFDEHMDEQRGDITSISDDIAKGSIENLELKEAHGTSFELLTDDHMGNSLMHVAAMSNSTEVAAFLLSRGLKLDAVNKYGETPLHLACSRNKNIQMVQFLVTRGAGYMQANSLGESPMDAARRCAFHEAVLYLSQLTINVSRAPGRPGTKKSQRVANL